MSRFTPNVTALLCRRWVRRALTVSGCLNGLPTAPQRCQGSFYSSSAPKLSATQRQLHARPPSQRAASAPPSTVAGPLAKAGAELAAAFFALAHAPGHRGPVAVRALAARVSPDCLEYLGEEHGGLAGFCRSRAASAQPIVAGDGTHLRVVFQTKGGVAYVLLSPYEQDRGSGTATSASAVGAEGSCMAGSDETVGRPWDSPLPLASRASLASEFMHRTLSSTFPPQSPLSVSSLKRLWRLQTEDEAARRALALVSTLAEWRALQVRTAARGRETVYPTVNHATGQVSADSATQIRNLLAASQQQQQPSDATSTATWNDAVQWEDQIALAFHNGKLAFLYVGAKHTRPSSEAPSHKSLAQEEQASSPPQVYDLHRMAAYLAVGRATPVDVVASNCAPVTSFHPLQVALAFPGRTRIHLSGAVTARKEELQGWTLLVRPDTHRTITGLSYVLPKEALGALQPNDALAHLSIEELEEAKNSLRHAAAPLKRSKLRKRYVRELFRRHFPQGNPFLDGEVVAQYLYDRMEPGRRYTNTVLKDEILPGGGKDTMHVGVDFFHKYPHLFIVRHVHATMAEVMRREEDMLDVAGDEALEGQRLTWTTAELHLWLLSGAFADAARHPDKALNMELIFASLPHYQRKAIKQQGSLADFVKRFLQAHPTVFVPMGEEGKYRLDTVAGAALANQLVSSMEKRG